MRQNQFSFSLDGKETGVAISCLSDSDTGGGLFWYEGRTLERLDSLSSTGLCTAGDRFIRLLRSTHGTYGVAELLVYDERGIERYYRLDSVVDPHDVLWHGSEFVVACTATNRIVWIAPGGKVTGVWRAPGNGDCWHVNSLVEIEGRVVACCFGRFTREREWAEYAGPPAGAVFDLDTERDLVTGLSMPHHPRMIDGRWVICNSGMRELLQVDPRTRTVTRRLELSGWTRGICVLDDYLLAGESALRRTAATQLARLAIIDRQSWQVLDRVTLPCLEIYDIVAAPPRLRDGLRRGFRTNGNRVAEQDQYAMFRQVGVEPTRLWAIGDPLPPEACRVRVEAEVPASVPSSAKIALDCHITNLGSAILVSAPPNPVHISCRWEPADSTSGAPKSHDVRFRLPRHLAPLQPVRCPITVEAPPPGRYRLHITLLQEQVCWFDDLDPSSALVCTLVVEPAHPPADSFQEAGQAVSPASGDTMTI